MIIIITVGLTEFAILTINRNSIKRIACCATSKDFVIFVYYNLLLSE